ncbi:hypothetical protein LJR090_001963 [Bosea sp. LjRoot90]|uniref:hypothetical protein n=1 Tax=Bosea sp. LjRoot90 TaxID=3342342 RepID=UPI003ECE651D
MTADFIDVALTFDPETRTADAELGKDGDLLLDETPRTPMLIKADALKLSRLSPPTQPEAFLALTATRCMAICCAGAPSWTTTEFDRLRTCV